jgi:hypothetical protein
MADERRWGSARVCVTPETNRTDDGLGLLQQAILHRRRFRRIVVFILLTEAASIIQGCIVVIVYRCRSTCFAGPPFPDGNTKVCARVYI